MADLKEYIACNGRTAAVPLGELNGWTDRFEWFSAARVVRGHITGEPDALTAALMSGRGVSSLKMELVETSKLCGQNAGEPTADEIIDRFLEAGDYRIVADTESEGPEVRTEAEFSDEDDIVSEELAEIYLSQGLKTEALAIYRKLSLLNTEKSVYFAEIIDKIENNN